MPHVYSPLTQAGSEYDQSKEALIRRELESIFLLIGEKIDAITNGSDTNGSLYSKREHLLSPPVRTIRYSGAGPAAGITYS
jgi:hypothetical protein